MRGYSGLANPKPCRDIKFLWIKLRLNNYKIKVAGTHIYSRLVAPDDNNLEQTIKITLRVALRKNEVLLNQKIFSKILIWFYTFSLCSDYFSDPLKMFRIMVNNKQLLSAMKFGRHLRWCSIFYETFFRRCLVAFHKKVTCVGATASYGGKRNHTNLP